MIIHKSISCLCRILSVCFTDSIQSQLSTLSMLETLKFYSAAETSSFVPPGTWETVLRSDDFSPGETGSAVTLLFRALCVVWTSHVCVCVCVWGSQLTTPVRSEMTCFISLGLNPLVLWKLIKATSSERWSTGLRSGQQTCLKCSELCDVERWTLEAAGVQNHHRWDTAGLQVNVSVWFFSRLTAG